MKVRCTTIINPVTGEEVESHPCIRVGAVYLVLGVHTEPRRGRTLLRVADEEGTPSLWNAAMFAPVDDAVPAGWAVAIAADGRVDLEPRAFLAPGFWEDFFDDHPRALAAYAEYLRASGGTPPPRRHWFDVLIPAAFVTSRTVLTAGELAYGHEHGRLTDRDVVALAEEAVRAGTDLPPPAGELALLLRDELDRVPALVAATAAATSEPEPARVWIFLALSWLLEHRAEYLDPFAKVDQFYTDFDAPADLEPLVRLAPGRPANPASHDQIDRRWRQYVSDRATHYARRRTPA